VVGMKRLTPQNTKITLRRPPMLTLNVNQNLFAAVVSIGISAILFATAIVPATPGLMA